MSIVLDLVPYANVSNHLVSLGKDNLIFTFLLFYLIFLLKYSSI
jgi:hypothetical protein